MDAKEVGRLGTGEKMGTEVQPVAQREQMEGGLQMRRGQWTGQNTMGYLRSTWCRGIDACKAARR